MDDEMLELTSRSDAEVVRRIEAFGDLRLSPSLVARARMRSAVMDAAQRAVDRDVRRGGRDDREGPGRSVRADPPSRPGGDRRSPSRRRP